MEPTSSSSDFLRRIRTETLPGLGPERRKDAQPVKAVRGMVASFCAERAVSSNTQELLMSGALLWHDHLEESHTISQGIHSVDGSFLHGIMHRREPDPGNAKYWWHRVGAHACFPALGRRAGEFLDKAGQSAFSRQIAPGGRWDPFAFVDACEKGRHGGNGELVQMLKMLQEIEFEVFIQHVLRTV